MSEIVVTNVASHVQATPSTVTLSGIITEPSHCDFVQQVADVSPPTESVEFDSYTFVDNEVAVESEPADDIGPVDDTGHDSNAVVSAEKSTPDGEPPKKKLSSAKFACAESHFCPPCFLR